MAGDRIDNLTEAKRLKDEYEGHESAFVIESLTPHGNTAFAVTGVGMDGIDADFETLRQTERELAGLHDELVGHLKDAAELTGPLGDGTSPVTGPMRKAFLDRADLEGGVQTALLDYLEELVGVRTAILQTLATYQGVEDDVADRLRTHAGQLEELS